MMVANSLTPITHLSVFRPSLCFSPSAHAQAKDLALEEQLALDPVDLAPAIMRIPEPAALSVLAAATQVESSNADESIAVVVPKNKPFIKVRKY